RKYSRSPQVLGDHLKIPTLPALIRRYLYGQEHADEPDLDTSTVPLDKCPDVLRKVQCFPSAIANFYAPSDQSGLCSAICEHIRAVRSWCRNAPRYDCVCVEADAEQPGFRGLLTTRVLLFLSSKTAASPTNVWLPLGSQPSEMSPVPTRVCGWWNPTSTHAESVS
ncbi:hypothetical protein K438DRAFT_2066568, partial [Mycena galopus ATCC 62051]